MVSLCTAGMQRIHNTRDELTPGAEQDAADRAQGDREDGQHHPPQVQRHPGAVETEHVRGGHDPQVAVLRRKVGGAILF